MSKQIIAIAGCIGSGKDTVGDYLVKNHGFTRMSWAGAVKDAVASIFGWDRMLLDGVTAESREWRSQEDPWWTERLDLGVKITPRWVLVNFATETMRHHFHPDIWVLSLENKILKHCGSVVITDTRFLNEMAAVRSMGGLIFGIHRRTQPWLSGFYKGVESRSTALGVDPFTMNFQLKNHRDVIVDIGNMVMQQQVRKDDRVHESEWQHVLWNDYDAVIDNRGPLLDTFLQVENQLI